VLIGQSYADAKGKVAEQKEQRAAKREAKRAEAKEPGEGRLGGLRRHRSESTGDDDAVG
jgi:hypothetical protein